MTEKAFISMFGFTLALASYEHVNCVAASDRELTVACCSRKNP